MKIILAHNYYRSSSPSGEDTVFRNEYELLQRHGVSVLKYEKFNDDIEAENLAGKLATASKCIWSGETYHELKGIIGRESPDIVHFHNTFPQISPSAYAACRDMDVRVVQTLHNYRLICPGALLQRDGAPCEDCVGKSLWPALRYRCYRGSLPATSAVVAMLQYNRMRSVYNDYVDKYIVLTDFAVSRLIAGGLPEHRLVIKPNFLVEYPDPGPGGGGYALFVGRLSHEKGILTLLDTWKSVRNLRLKIVGDGPLKDRVANAANSSSGSVEYLGRLDKDSIFSVLGFANMLVIPSECYEGMPMVVLESLACGTPVLASRIGGLDEIVSDDVNGLKFTPGDTEDLLDKVQRFLSDPKWVHNLRESARLDFDRRYAPEVNYTSTMNIYKSILGASR